MLRHLGRFGISQHLLDLLSRELRVTCSVRCAGTTEVGGQAVKSWEAMRQHGSRWVRLYRFFPHPLALQDSFGKRAEKCSSRKSLRSPDCNLQM